MRHRSPIWTKLAARGKFSVESVAEINGVTYNKISAPQIERSLMSDPLSVGNCISATLKVSILTDDVIDTTAPIKIKARLTDGNISSEWLEFGTFYVDLPDTSYEGLLTLSCYDSMLKTSQSYVDDSDSEDEWPKPMKTCVEEIAYRIGVGIDPRTRINTGVNYLVPYPSGRTMQQVLGFIGAVHGGNWIITEENLLRLIPVITSPDDTFNIIDQDYETIMTDDGYRLAYRLTGKERVETQPSAPGSELNSIIPVSRHITDELYNPIVTSDGYYLVYGLDGSADAVGGLINVPIVVGNITTGKTLVVSKVTMSDENSNTYSYGDDSGYEMSITSNPYASSGACKALYEAVKGLVYQPYTATSACYDPATELGDWVKIGDKVCSVIYTMTLSLDIDYRSDISAPNNNELSRQYPFLTEVDKLQSKDLLNADTDYAGVTLNTQDGLTVKKSGASATRSVERSSSLVKAEVALNERKISLQGINADGDMEDCIFYDDSIGAYRIKSSVQIDGIQDQSDAITDLQEKVKDIQSSAGSSSESITELQKTVKTHETSISELKSSVSAHTSDIKALQDTVSEHETKISDNATKISSLEKDMTSVKSSVKSHDTDIDTLKGKTDTLTAADEQFAEQMQALQNTVDEHSTKIADIETKITDILSRLTALENAASTTE